MKAIIPPPVVLVICGTLMWLMDRFLPSFKFAFPYRTLFFWIILLGGLSVFASGVFSIIKRKTTIHPDHKSLLKPTALVTRGIFRYTRNPIYLGMAIMLLAWMVFLESWLSIAGLIFFVAFITRYQIMPEEEALAKVFGEEYNRYRNNVRRWV
jgi:protein-S-isoprenylcysteine O-methyltransferase Ste14